MSACLFGMLLDVTKMSMLLQRLSSPSRRDLPLVGPDRRAYPDFYLPASGSFDRQTHSWWLHPLTELLWLNAPPMPAAMTLGEQHPW